MSCLRRGTTAACVALLALGWAQPQESPEPAAAFVPLYSAAAGVDASGRVVQVPPTAADPFEPGTRVLRGTPGNAARRARQLRWAGEGCVPGRGTRFEDLAVDALLDLETLTAPSGGVLAGPVPLWQYVWPRDTSFAAAALAVSGHGPQAVRALEFLQEQQHADGRFAARYLPDGTGVPDARLPQLDGSGWVLWALDVVLERTPEPDRAAVLGRLRGLLVRSTEALLSSIDPATGLPRPSSDYWERPEQELTLGTAAPVLAGLDASARVHTAAGDRVRAAELHARARRLEARVLKAFGRNGFQRYLRGGGADAAVTMLLPPFLPARPEVMAAARSAAGVMRRPAGGLAPGESWQDDGISWTPQTALFALAAASTGDPEGAAARLAWLDEHRTAAGALPEKVLASGAPAAVAPLAWTAALVLLTLDRLTGGPCRPRAPAAGR